ncbi:MAG: glycosyltransferase family 2 protein [Dysgonamonadaceae bacterium]|jgi:hypothetical protein|nr:glycosyltransferase family 2 protein [Dysgonamonadaceae bacterium]
MDDSFKIPKLSFCITCKDRFFQINKTLPQNLDDNKLYKDLIEFVLVDFGSQDGLRDWVLQHFGMELSEGYLKYYYTEELPFWHASIAKNTSHLLANHDILVNLDCDNYTGHNGGRFIIRQFLKHGEDIFIHQYGGGFSDGSYGRIAINRDYFFQLGGYDESFEPMAYQDTDLLDRLQALGLKYRGIPDEKYNRAIKNTKEEGLFHVKTNISWDEKFYQNMEK